MTFIGSAGLNGQVGAQPVFSGIKRGGNAENEGRDRRESMLLTEECRDGDVEKVFVAAGVVDVVAHLSLEGVFVDSIE